MRKRFLLFKVTRPPNQEKDPRNVNVMPQAHREGRGCGMRWAAGDKTPFLLPFPPQKLAHSSFVMTITRRTWSNIFKEITGNLEWCRRMVHLWYECWQR